MSFFKIHDFGIRMILVLSNIAIPMTEKWRETERKEREERGFYETHQSRKMGVDGIREVHYCPLTKVAYTDDDIDIRDNESDGVWDHLIDMDTKVISKCLGWKYTLTRHSILLGILDDIAGNVCWDIFPIESYDEILEVKDWIRAVTADRVRELRDKMTKWKITHAILAGHRFTRRSRVRAREYKQVEGITIKLEPLLEKGVRKR